MQKSATFQVYNASAGSGKTFTLVKEYLKVILTADDIFTFQKILAITFTNKAAGEMKERVLVNLEEFANGIENDLFLKVVDETKVEKDKIKERSKKILEAILQNYAAFNITTIDSFTHKIIKSFAHDLGLSQNFEVEMDAVSLLNQAVEVIISNIGVDAKLTKLLIDYSLEKTDDDKSWDISRDLAEFAKILLNEDDQKHFQKLATKKFEDFTSLKEKLQKENKEIEQVFEELATTVLNFISNNELSETDFSYKDYPNHFKKIKNIAALKSEDFNFEGRLYKKIAAKENLYSASIPAANKDIIDGIATQLHAYFYISQKLFETSFRKYAFNRVLLKSITQLAVLNNINAALEAIKEDNNIRLIAEFNQLIAQNIKDQPAPFIYERIGHRFSHFFIDEMQDTSLLQWENLIPLIDNALAQESSNLLLVGDGKQAIYRWRGGKAEQFISLGIDGEGGQNPFQVSKKIQELDTNYRSYSEIINFNNQFFQHVANFFKNEAYKNIFIEGNKQLENAKKGGYVSLDFLLKEEDKEENKLRYPKKVLEKIIELKESFSLSEICVLTRSKKDGIAVADYLSENNIDIVSNETLLLNNNAKIKFIITVLEIIQHPNNQESRFEFLYFLHEHLHISLEKNQFLEEYLAKNNELLFQDLKQYGIEFQTSIFHQKPFYEKIEEIIRGFQLIDSSDAYIQFFLDIVLEQQRKGTDIQDFLHFWDLKKESLSIVAPESSDAVQIMTIHKSKGLEFPVVIFPCDVDIYQQIKPKVWLDDLPKDLNFKELLVDYSKDVGFISKRGKALYDLRREALELDNFNLLYVALTRAVERLYIITENSVNKAGSENKNMFSGVFINYLKNKEIWKKDTFQYSFGDKKRVSEFVKVKSATEHHQKFIGNPWQDHNIVLLSNSSKLWDTAQGDAINYGNLIHQIFSKIVSYKDASSVLLHFYEQGFMDKNQLESITTIVNSIVAHPKLQPYFSEDVTVFNEREIVTENHQIIIPDRLVFNKHNEVVIIDYKTGNPSELHVSQLHNYSAVLESMQFIVKKKLLVYCNHKIDVVEV